MYFGIEKKIGVFFDLESRYDEPCLHIVVIREKPAMLAYFLDSFEDRLADGPRFFDLNSRRFELEEELTNDFADLFILFFGVYSVEKYPGGF